MTHFSFLNDTFILSGKLTIYKVTEIRKILIQTLATEQKNKNFYLDLENIEFIDSAMLQLLISLKVTITENNGHLFVKKSNQHFDSLLEIFALPADTFPKVSL